ncbi:MULTISPECIES: restriction endonuclease [unclassified Rothia (in: high G+C Gram-positive bacteria)]|uniref:restriction endonuclease n=1 Tax=unclassified Rothia (in: high G+C Gram-positive bacteria) TaxID=2689056 RepID=UPI0008A84A69|nr:MULTISPECIES: restriction endonuclease [unclassified Rothia (in: high G+C Gram-positive bacteria)]MBF1655839.1 restriction endonuclease [Rothia sp. (in: high G+C Gram-positive bacteria)]OHQ21056.1 D-alanine--D-alanine ligase [Rothia sp. HMSC065C03]
MAFVNKTMLHIDHSELHSLQQETSWEALPEEARTLSVAAAFSLLRHFERAQDRGEKVFFPDMYTPVGVDLGFNMTQRFIAVGDNVLFREALNKLIAALVNADYLEVSLSQLHPGNLHYTLSEAGRELLGTPKEQQAQALLPVLPLLSGVYLYYLKQFYPVLLSHITVRELLPIVLSVTPSYPAAAPVKIRELVLRECGFVQGWYGLSYLEQRIVEPVIAQALSLLTREGYLRTKTIHEHTDSPLTLYSLSPSAKELVARHEETGVPASELSSVLALVKDEGTSITAEDIAATDALLTHMGVLLLDTLNDHGADVELSLPSLEQVFDRDERIQQASSNPYFVQIDAQDYIYDVLTAHHYLSERETVYSLGSAFAPTLAQMAEPSVQKLVASALLDPAAVDALPYPHQLLYPILKLVEENPRISYYDIYDELKIALDIPYLQGEVAPHRYKLTPRLRNRYSVAMHVLKGERYLNALREGTGRTSRKNPERYELSEAGKELLKRFPEGAPEAVTARMAPLPPQSLKHKLPQDIAAELQAREEALQAAKEARAAERQARLAAREGREPLAPVPGASPALLARPAGSPVVAAAQAPAEVPAAPVAAAPVVATPAQPFVSAPAVSAAEPSTALQVAAAQVREALKRYRQVFRREALAPALAQVSEERFRSIGFDLFLMRGYTVEALQAQGVDGVATPATGEKERAFYVRTLRPVAGGVLSASVQPQDITAFFLAIHARGGQLGTFITNAPFSDEAYDEFIRCSTKYPNILVDLVSGDELQDRLIAHRLGVVEGANGLLELNGEYFAG